MLAQLLAKYKDADKKYDALADKIAAEVKKALQSTPWLSEQDKGPSRPFTSHPFIVWSDRLAEAAAAASAGALGRKPAVPSALLARFPWGQRLELDLGLDLGSNRPVPRHETGFIDLGDAPLPFAGFPELSTSQYLYGLQEITHWRCGVTLGKTKLLAFAGRDPKNPPRPDPALPGFEKIRIYLQGSRPDIPVLAVPQLTHAIHSRLAERRRSTGGEIARMDEVLAFLDSKWNGFFFRVPYAKERLAVVMPVHALMTDRNGFFNRFPASAHMAAVGDLPFLAIQSRQQYAQAFQHAGAPVSESTQHASGTQPTDDSLDAACAYLSRYKVLLDQFVRVVLSPNLRFPEHLAFLDYPKDKWPLARDADPALDVPRRHAVLVWAYVGKDPVKLADFLFDTLFDREENRFPNHVNLAAQFTIGARAQEQEMLDAIAARIAAERVSPSADSQGATPSDFEREFSPYPGYLDAAGKPGANALLHSFQSFHERATRVIQDAAYRVVLKEIGK